MDIIAKCATTFQGMLDTCYQFDISKKRYVHTIILDFKNTDFYHLAGLQYLEDLRFDRNPRNTIGLILRENPVLTEGVLKKSVYYRCKANEVKDIESRLSELVYLEEYLDTDNIIKIFTMRDIKGASSQINADYVILSKRTNSLVSSYIFLRKRKETETYCVVSFFKKGRVDYGGEKLYWMMKAKIKSGVKTVLFKHKNYNPID